MDWRWPHALRAERAHHQPVRGLHLTQTNRQLRLVTAGRCATARAWEFLRHAPFQVDLGSRVEHLAAGQKQKVEILKQLYLETRLLVLDEPTSVLTPAEAIAENVRAAIPEVPRIPRPTTAMSATRFSASMRSISRSFRSERKTCSNARTA